MKRILFLCHGAGNGGAERVITTLANSFAERNYSVQLVTTNKSNNDYELNPKIEHKLVISNGCNSLFRTIDRVLQLRYYIRSYAPDCIISFSAIPNMQAIVANFGLKSKVIISERTDPSRYPTSYLGRAIRKFLYPMADWCVFQTEEAKEYFSQRIQNSSSIIPNPIRDNLPEPFTGRRENKIVGIGSLSEQKNWNVALKACEIFFKSYPEYTFDIYGEGPLQEQLQDIIDGNEYLQRRVKLRGFAPNVLEKILHAKIYISSSNYEGISNAMLEALAIGVPVICTDCPVGGARKTIEAGVNGFLVPVGDYISLGKTMIQLVEDEKLCENLSRNSIKIKEQLNLEKIINLWEDEVKKVCQK